MKIIFLALAFPKMNRTKYLYTQLITKLNDHGHDITVVAPTHKGDKSGLQIEAGIKFIRVSTLPLFGVGMIRKGIANIMLPYFYKKAIKKLDLNLDFDLIIIPTPPITLYGIVAWLKPKSRAKVYLILRDIFPQNAVDLELMKKNSLIHRYFRKKEQKLYGISDAIGCMSEGNIDFIKKHQPNLTPSKLHLLPNWGDIVPLETEESLNELKTKMGLKDKFVLIFGGNIGLPQKMENIVNLAIACAGIEDIVFLIIGRGNKWQHLEQLIAQRNVKNIILKNSLPIKEYFKLVQIADVGLISLSEDFTIPNIPSKALSYYNAKKPILASIDTNTDFGQILEENNTGLWAEAGNTEALKNKLLLLYNDRTLRKTMGENGQRYMKENLSSESIYNIIISQVQKA